MEGDRGKDRVRQFRLLTAFLQDGPSVNVLPLSLTLANGCNPTTSFAQAFQHASSNDIHSHDE